MAEALIVKIITPEKVIYEGEVASATIPTLSGEITVLPGHMPLITALSYGEMKIKFANEKEGDEKVFAIYKGIAKISPEEGCVILSDDITPHELIDEKKVEEAYERARKYMEEKKNISDVEYAKMRALMEKELNKLNIARRRRRMR